MHPQFDCDLIAKQQAARIAELEAERDNFYMEYRMKCDVETKQLHEELAVLRRKIDELEAWQQLAFEAHPNLDLDIEHISKEDLK